MHFETQDGRYSAEGVFQHLSLFCFSGDYFHIAVRVLSELCEIVYEILRVHDAQCLGIAFQAWFSDEALLELHLLLVLHRMLLLVAAGTAFDCDS